MAERYAPVLMTDEETVVASYEPLPPATGKRQTEAELESDFVERLVSQGYERTVLKNERELLDNLRTQLETLNGFGFSDSEWERFRDEVICNPNLKTEDKTELIQRENVQPMKLDDGTSRNVLLIDKKNPLRNRLQVMRQYSDRKTRNDDRYDVTILVNGLPLVHTELKRRGKSLKDAFYQIERYGKESFCEGSALFEFVQIFVISNGTETKYYSNTTRRSHVDNRGGNKSREAIGNWKFASWWTDARNRPILSLENFARTFFARRTILNILTKYCIFTADRRLLVMRPYQISAAERFVARARTAIENGLLGTQDANAFMWGATGCGKTLTSYKTSQLLSDLLGLDAVLFTVDRADLDNQTRAEYENFQPGCVDGNKSTKVLERQLGEIAERGTTANGNDMIVTTIQKLSRFVKNNPKHPIYDKKVAILFDECHRSQFGEMRRAISKAFRKSCMFGFTGTPIFAENAGTGRNAKATTTAQLFGGPKVVDENGVERILPLQTYTMVDSIRDGNTLPFMIEYWDTLGKARNGTDEKVIDIDRDTAWEAPERISLVTSTILDQFDAKTKRGVRTKSGYSGDKMNGMLCCGSVNGAMKYHAEFERQIAERGLDLKVAVIYTSPTGEGPADGFDCGLIDDEPLTTEGMPENARKYLEGAIERYSAAFSKQVDMKSPDGFEKYYEDVSQKMKSGELDLLIVVNMFLTGFDSARLNTLWVDKNLRMHGLIQAFSRTNRILDSVKSHGNVVCFRPLKNAVDEAVAIFSDENASSVLFLRDYDSYYQGYDDDDGNRHPGYAEIVDRLKREFPIGTPVVGNKKKRGFVRLFNSLLVVENMLSGFPRFENERLLSERETQDYRSVYLGIVEETRSNPHEVPADIEDDVTYEMELLGQTEVDIDYVLDMLEKLRKRRESDAIVETDVMRAVGSSERLRSKRKLVEAFVEATKQGKPENVRKDWNEFVERKKTEDVLELIEDEHLVREKAEKFIRETVDAGNVDFSENEIDATMPPVSFFEDERENKVEQISERIRELVRKYSDV